LANASDDKLGARPTRIAPEFEQRVGCAGEEQVDEECTVGERQRAQLGWKTNRCNQSPGTDAKSVSI